ncbi:MAG TPA: molecular chaperone DnaK, partial [Bacilli bacterium]|nr:molecular chaperone DnaK [Bacilli bacterium]
FGDKVEQAEIDKANEAKEKLQKVLAEEDIEAIRTAKDELQEVVQQLSVKLYEEAAKAAQAAQGAEDGAEQKADDNVVDADYEEVNDDDKK